jgi:hypothetical protein
MNNFISDMNNFIFDLVMMYLVCFYLFMIFRIDYDYDSIIIKKLINNFNNFNDFNDFNFILILVFIIYMI